MSAPTTPADLLDLKMMPAWVNEPAGTNEYADYAGDDDRPLFERRGPRPERGRDQRPRGRKPGGDRDGRRDGSGRRERRDDRSAPRGGPRPERGPREQRPAREMAPLPQVSVRFLPHQPAFENVIAQIKAGSVAYSVFALARLFLDKPERYDVRLTAAEGAALHQIGEHGAVAADPRILESNAFSAAKDDFYTVEVTQTEPLKGNFSNVARERVSGMLLGPTNHHSYQPQLRSLYEQRFSRRMSFQDFQRQIEIVSDPTVVEQWKEQARSVTTYTTKAVEPAVTFNSAADAERHFRQTHLPALLRSAQEMTVGGVLSRSLPDRALGRVIEDAWAAEIRSPSKMMQELAGGLRQAGLNIFRHRRGMLYVSPIRTRVFSHDRGSVSPTVSGILDKLVESPAMNRKQLLEKFTPEGTAPEETERVKMTLASDLRWLISEGYVIEFNDGSLDLPRAKAPAPVSPEQKEPANVAVPVPGTESEGPALDTSASTPGDAAGTPLAAQPSAETPAEQPTADTVIKGDPEVELPQQASVEIPAEEPPAAQSTVDADAEAAVTPQPDIAPVTDDGLSATGEDVGGMAVEQAIEPTAQSDDRVEDSAGKAEESTEPDPAPRTV